MASHQDARGLIVQGMAYRVKYRKLDNQGNALKILIAVRNLDGHRNTAGACILQETDAKTYVSQCFRLASQRRNRITQEYAWKGAHLESTVAANAQLSESST